MQTQCLNLSSFRWTKIICVIVARAEIHETQIDYTVKQPKEIKFDPSAPTLRTIASMDNSTPAEARDIEKLVDAIKKERATHKCGQWRRR